MDIASIRRQYGTHELHEKDLADHPVDQFQVWLGQAIESKLFRDPTAMTVATVDEQGMPSQRVVLLKNYDHKGFVFFTNLESNTYSLCLIPKSNPTYQRCYEISIRNPAPLEVQSFTNWDAKTVLLQLSGEPPFTVNHNESSIQTSEKFYQLNLVKGVNKIAVTPSSECQGSFDSELFLSEDVRIFPNPIKDITNIYVGGNDTKVQLTLKDLNSQLIESKTFEIPSNRIIQLPVNHLKTGMYFIELKSLEVQKELKLVKA